MCYYRNLEPDLPVLIYFASKSRIRFTTLLENQYFYILFQLSSLFLSFPLLASFDYLSLFELLFSLANHNRRKPIASIITDLLTMYGKIPRSEGEKYNVGIQIRRLR